MQQGLGGISKPRLSPGTVGLECCLSLYCLSFKTAKVECQGKKEWLLALVE